MGTLFKEKCDSRAAASENSYGSSVLYLLPGVRSGVQELFKVPVDFEIPAANVKPDVVASTSLRQWVPASSTSMAELPAGELNQEGEYSLDSFNGKLSARLKRFALAGRSKADDDGLPEGRR